jgi:hypothetical protein
MSDGSIVGTVITACIASATIAAGWHFSHKSQRSLAARKDRLILLNEQLEKLYGPLCIACVEGKVAYQALLKKLDRKKSIFEDGNQPSQEELEEWFHWMKIVFMPLNQLREKIILENTHLIYEKKIPDCFVEFSTHVVSYRVLMAKWEAKNFTETYSPVDFPVDFDPYVQSTFEKLKAEQSKLIGQLERTTHS